MTVTAWDDFPVHQASEWIAHPATSDRNFYDRYYFNAFDTTGEWIAVMGLGQYPNLGVTDAFATVRIGPQQHLVRASRPLVHSMASLSSETKAHWRVLGAVGIPSRSPRRPADPALKWRLSGPAALRSAG
jgi:hypothetical protein